MSENKEYVSKTEPEGSVNISEYVISLIAAEAVKEIKGVGSMGSGHNGKELLSKKNSIKGVKINVVDDSVTIDVYFFVVYGYSVNEVAAQVQSAAAKAVEDMTGLNVIAVNVHINGVIFDKEKQ